MTTTAPPLTAEQTARLAEYLVLVRFDCIRTGLFGDMARSRRGHELSRLADALIASGVPVVTDRETSEPFAGWGFPTVSAEALRAAFERVARPRVERIGRESYRARTPYTQATLAAWQRVEGEINVARGREALASGPVFPGGDYSDEVAGLTGRGQS